MEGFLERYYVIWRLLTFFSKTMVSGVWKVSLSDLGFGPFICDTRGTIEGFEIWVFHQVIWDLAHSFATLEEESRIWIFHRVI